MRHILRPDHKVFHTAPERPFPMPLRRWFPGQAFAGDFRFRNVARRCVPGDFCEERVGYFDGQGLHDE